MSKKEKILICGILPPPSFGHSMIYKALMQSEFIGSFDVIFLNMKFWSYKRHKKVTVKKVMKLFRYFSQYVFSIITRRPKYVLYNISFDKMPLLKDFLFCSMGRMLGCRIILHDMGQYVEELYHSSNHFYKWLIIKLTKMSTASIVLGEKARDAYQPFMDRHKVIAVPGAVEDSGTCDTNANIVKSNNPRNKKINVLYFSFLSTSKGLFTALHGMREVLKENQNIFFTFGGPMESSAVKKKMDRFVSENQFESHINYLGYIENEDKRTSVFREADIFVFPTHRDVFGLVLLHAMAENLPVVASIEGAIPEIIEHEKNGFLFAKGNYHDLAKNILILAGDAKLREKVGRENRCKYLNYYTPKKYGERMIAAFHTIQKLG